MEDLNNIFNALKTELTVFSPPFVIRNETARRFELWSGKDLVIEGRRRKEVYFAGLIIQKGYVGFYFMPVYIEAEMKQVFPPELLRLLKGKSCFHVNNLNGNTLIGIRAALKTGFDLYQQRGWV